MRNLAIPGSLDPLVLPEDVETFSLSAGTGSSHFGKVSGATAQRAAVM
jgi:hypothetical protein